jgi:D-serine deaminase-like pyridoxal phosphate-dependent protein
VYRPAERVRWLHGQHGGSEIVMHINDLDTPAVLISVDVAERNLERLAQYCRHYGLSLRPHTKTHKIPEFAHRQLRHGAVGITVAKLGEAEVMADAGVSNILIAYPLVGERKMRRLLALALRTDVTVAVDSLEVAAEISHLAVSGGMKIGVLAEFNTGFRRCGLPVEAAAMSVVQRIRDLPGLKWCGVLFYPGQIMTTFPAADGLIAEQNVVISRLMDLLKSAGLEHSVVSGGNTPTAYLSHKFVGVTEIRPGTYLFNDKNTVCGGAATWSDCAVTVLTSVVSKSVQGRAMIDAGSKTLSSDSLLTGDRSGYGQILEYPEVAITELSEEHGHLDLGASPRIPGIGERLRVIPNHVCVVMNLHDKVYGIQGEEVIEEWRVAGRGKVQ